MMNVQLYSCTHGGIRGFCTDTGVPVLPEYSIFWYARVKRMRKVVYDMTAVEVYMYMYMYSGYSGYK